jgi:hypothetical protein
MMQEDREIRSARQIRPLAKLPVTSVTRPEKCKKNKQLRPTQALPPESNAR